MDDSYLTWTKPERCCGGLYCDVWSLEVYWTNLFPTYLFFYCQRCCESNHLAKDLHRKFNEIGFVLWNRHTLTYYFGQFSFVKEYGQESCSGIGMEVGSWRLRLEAEAEILSWRKLKRYRRLILLPCIIGESGRVKDWEIAVAGSGD